MNNVDNRIVQMEFDNALFEKNVRQSMASLQAFDDQLESIGRKNGMDKVVADSKQVPSAMSAIEESVQKVIVAYNTWSTVATTVTVRLTNDALNLGKKIANKLWAPIIEGGKRRSLNIQQAKFMLKGLGVAWKDIEDDIKFGVDQTAYGLDAAAKAAGSLKASGVELGDDMKKSLRAISGVASMTNREYSDIAHIFTTVASNGKLMTMQLRQLSYAGFNASKVLADAMNKTEAEINDMVSKGKIAYKEFAEAMYNAYGEHAVEANNTFTGSLANMKAALSKIGVEFADPVYEEAIKLFNILRIDINAIKIDLQSIGVFDFWKSMVRGVMGFVEKLASSQYFVMSIAQLLRNTYLVVRQVVEAFKQVFDIKDIDSLLKPIFNFLKAMEPSGEKALELRHLFIDIFEVIKSLGLVVKDIFEIARPMISPLLKFLSTALNLIHLILSSVTNSETPLGAAVENLKELIKVNLGDFIKNVAKFLNNIKAEDILKVITAILLVVIKLSAIGIRLLTFAGSAIAAIISNLDVLFVAIKKVFGKTETFLSSIGSSISSLFNGGKKILSLDISTNGVKNIPIFGKLSNVVDGLLKKNDELEESNDKLAESFDSTNDKIDDTSVAMTKTTDKAYFLSKDNSSNVSKMMTSDFEGFSNDKLAKEFIDSEKDLANGVSDARKKYGSEMEESFKQTEKRIDSSIDRVADRSTKKTEKKVERATGIFTSFFDALSNALGLSGTVLGNFISGIGDVLQLTTNFIGNAISKLINIATEPKNIFKIIVTSILLKLLTSVSLFTSIGDMLSGDTLSDRITAFMQSMRDFAVGFAMILGAILLFVNLINIDKFERVCDTLVRTVSELSEMIKYIIYGFAYFEPAMNALSALFGAEGQMYKAKTELNKAVKEAAKAFKWAAITGFLVTFTASLFVLTKLIRNLASIPTEELKTGAHRLGVLAVCLLGVIAVVGILSKIFDFSKNTKLNVSGTKQSTVFGGVLSTLLNRKTGDTSGPEAYVETTSALGGLTRFLISFVASITALTIVLKMLGNIPSDVYDAGAIRLNYIIGGLMAVLTVISVGAWAISKFSKTDGEDVAALVSAMGEILKTITNQILKVMIYIGLLGIIDKDGKEFNRGAKRLAWIAAGISVFFLALGASVALMTKNTKTTSDVAIISDMTFTIMKLMNLMLTLISVLIISLTAMKGSISGTQVASLAIIFVSIGAIISGIFIGISKMAKDYYSSTSKYKIDILRNLKDIILSIMGGVIGLIAAIDILAVALARTDIAKMTDIANILRLALFSITIILAIVEVFTFTVYKNGPDSKTKSFKDSLDAVSNLLANLFVGLVGLFALIDVMIATISVSNPDSLDKVFEILRATMIGIGLIFAALSAFVYVISNKFKGSSAPGNFVKSIAAINTLIISLTVSLSIMLGEIVLLAGVLANSKNSNFKSMTSVIGSIMGFVGEILAAIFVFIIAASKIEFKKVGSFIGVFLAVSSMITVLVYSVTQMISSLGSLRSTSLDSLPPVIDSLCLLFLSIGGVLAGISALAVFGKGSATAGLTVAGLMLVFTQIIYAAQNLAVQLSEIRKVDDFDKSVKAFNDLLVGLGVLLGVFEAIGVIAAVLPNGMGMLIEALALIFGAVSITLISELGWAIGKFGEGLEDFADGVDAILDPIERFITFICDKFDDAGTSIKDFAATFTTAMLGISAAGILGAVALAALGVALPIFGVGLAVFNVLTEPAFENFEELIDKVKEIVSPIAALMDLLENPELIKFIIEKAGFDEFIKSPIDELGIRIDNFKISVDNLNETIIALTSTIESLGKVYDSPTNDVVDMSIKTVDKNGDLRKILKSDFPGFSNKYKPTKDKDSDVKLVAGGGKYTLSATPKLVGLDYLSIGDVGDFLGWVLTGGGVETTLNFINDPIGTWNATSSAVIEELKKTNTPFGAFLRTKDKVEEILDFGSDVKDKAKEFADDPVGTISKYADDLLGALNDADFTNLLTGLKGMLGDVLDGLGLSDLGDSLWAALGGTSKSEYNTIVNNYNDARSGLSVMGTLDPTTGEWSFGQQQLTVDTSTGKGKYVTGTWWNGRWYTQEELENMQRTTKEYDSETGTIVDKTVTYDAWSAAQQVWDKRVEEYNAAKEELDSVGPTSMSEMLTYYTDEIAKFLDSFGGSDQTSSDLASSIASTSGTGSGINDISKSNINQINSNNTFNFTQNNYSPEALSRTELYKQTRSQLQDWTGFMRSQPT